MLLGCATTRPVFVGQNIDLTLPRLGGGELSLEELRGRVVVLDVWASWCGPCVASMPFYAELQKTYGPEGLTIVGLSVDEDERAATAFLQGRGEQLVTLRDPGAEVATTRLKVRRMPTAFFIDRQGVVRHTLEGFSANDRDAIRQTIERLLASGSE